MKNHIRSERHFALLSGEFADTKPWVGDEFPEPHMRSESVGADWEPEAFRAHLEDKWTPLLVWFLGVPVLVAVIALVAVFA